MPHRQLSELEIELLKIVGRLAQSMGTTIENLAVNPSTDKRWLSLARTYLQLGTMALKRSIEKPEEF